MGAYFIPKQILLPFEKAFPVYQLETTLSVLIGRSLTEKPAVEFLPVLEIQPALRLELV